MEPIKTSIKSYWNWRSRTFGHDTDKSAAVADKWESILQKTVSGAPGNRVLDIGTGTGQLAVYLARAGFDVTGMDIAENMVVHASRYAASQQLDIRFQTGDAENLPFADNSFDAVVSRNLLWTLPHPDKASEGVAAGTGPGRRSGAIRRILDEHHLETLPPSGGETFKRIVKKRKFNFPALFLCLCRAPETPSAL
jgi:2-polyprenyl-3-methyl-5-hydroxy-6-metoxy-1,4-benzoquinol methylase